MQWQNDSEIPTPPAAHEQAPEMNSARYYEQSSSAPQPSQQQTNATNSRDSSHYYEQPSGAQQSSQQQTYYTPAAAFSASPHPQPSVVAMPPLTASQLAAIFSYSFGLVTGLLFVLFGGRDRFLRFHALQSLFFFGGITLMEIGLFKIMLSLPYYYEYDYGMRFIPFLCVLAVLALNGIGVVGWIVAMIQTGRGAYFKLPIVGELIARRMNLQAVPRP